MSGINLQVSISLWDERENKGGQEKQSKVNLFQDLVLIVIITQRDISERYVTKME